MGDSLQDAYSKQLRQSYGFPLRIPEPGSTLPQSYQDGGLQIGDVGHVDSNGVFNVLFNIRRFPDHELHARQVLPDNFRPIDFDESTEINIIANSIPHGCVISSPSIRREVPPKNPSVLYEFIPSTPTGAILILPSGAICHELREKEKFRRVAMEQGRDWCAFARRDSLYLITGSYKARAWTLGSFRNAPGSSEARIKVVRGDENAGLYRWDPSFSLDWRCASGPCNNDDPQNQTVLVNGFSITVRWWAPAPVVELVPEPRRAAFIKFIRLLILIWLHRRRKNPQLRIDHEPRLSEPFHPSDAINRFLLDKDPEAEVAITHDDQWISMLEEKELTYDDIAQEGRLVAFLSDRCDSGSVAVWNENGAASLLSKRYKHVTIAQRQESPSRSTGLPPRNLVGFSRPRLPRNDLQRVITRIRAEDVNIGLQRLPVGFYIGIQFDGATRRTKSKSVLLSEGVVEWDDQLLLPSDQSVNVVVKICASFELNPTLGDGETLHVFCTTVELLGNSQVFTLSSEDGKASPWCSSLLVVVERRLSNHLGAGLNQVDTNSVDLARTTDLGHDALLRYYKDYRKEDFDGCLGHFRHAADICPADHPCRAVVLSNLATAECLGCQVDGANLVSPISRYREALELRPVGHPDRPATLLHLAQALMYRYRAHGCEDCVASEIEELTAELRDGCDLNAQMRRAADLVLQTYHTYRAINSGSLADLDTLIQELDGAARAPPEGHFDRPDRLNNLSVALLKRFELLGDLGDLGDIDQAISDLEDVLRPTPDGHPRKPRYLNSLGNSFFIRFDRLGEPGDLDQAVSRFEDAVGLIPDRHPDRPQYLYPLAQSLLLRFQRRDDLDDIDQATLQLDDVVRLTSDSDGGKAGYLHDLGNSLFTRFRRVGDLSDLDRGISSLAEAIRRTPEADSVGAGYANSLRNAFRICCERHGDLVDLDQVYARLENARADDVLTCLQNYKQSYPSPEPLQEAFRLPISPPHVSSIMQGSPSVSNVSPSWLDPFRLPDNAIDVVIAVMGPTGSGKSTLINSASRIGGQGAGHSPRSFKSEVTAVRFHDPESGLPVVLVDTPGFDDTFRSDLEILDMISKWLNSSYKQDKLLSGILYLHRITDNRMTGTSLKNLRVFQKLCGKDAFGKVFLTTTMWNAVRPEVGERRLEMLKAEMWDGMLRQGAQIAQFRNDDDDESAKKLIRLIVGQESAARKVRLQQEMGDLHKELKETEAGQELYSNLERSVEKQMVLLRRINTERKAAPDGGELAELQREYDELQVQVDDKLRQMQQLKLSLTKRVFRFLGSLGSRSG